MNPSLQRSQALIRVAFSVAIACTTISLVQAQVTSYEDNTWTESAVAPPEIFSIDVVQTFDVAARSTLQYAIDPGSLHVGEDGVVRFVLIARSVSGALNVFYQGIRCSTGETRNYAHLNDKRSWNISADAPWQALSFSGPTRPAMMLARQGVCDGRTITGSPQKIIATLKSDRTSLR